MMGGVPEDVMLQNAGDSTGEIIPVNVPLSVDPIIGPGHRYYVSVNANDASYIWGVKINYQQ